MKLLASVLPKVRRFLPSAERGMAIFVVSFLLGLEVIGRHTTSELQDALACSALLCMILFVVSWHRSQNLSWVNRIGRFFVRLGARFENLRYDIGIDFRGKPELPSKHPKLVSALFIGLLCWTCIAAVAWRAYPEGWRNIGLNTSYIAYLLVLLVVWTLLISCGLAGVYFPVSVLDQQMRTASGETDPRRIDMVVVVGYGVLAMLVAWVTPPVYGLSLCLLTTCLALLVSLARVPDDASILWRKSVGGTIYQVPLRQILAIGVAAVSFIVFNLLLTACGGRLLDPPSYSSAMPITMFVGTVVAWLVPGMLLLSVFQLWQFRKADPTRRQTPIIQVLGKRPAPELLRASRYLASWGFRPWITVTRTPAPKQQARHLPRANVAVQIVEQAQSEAMEFEPRWPLKVSLDDLKTTILKDRLARRDEIQLRRQFYRGMSGLLKAAALSVPSAGGGFWLAPHWWFIGSLLWEEPMRGRGAEPDPLRPVGPPYQLVFAPRVRQHLHQILRSLEIDLIYVEHGVTHRKLAQVLRAATEVYDIHGGKRRAEEHHFHGVPKIRVMMHDYTPGNPFRSGDYPEPKFDDVSRFRVLHVFKDRGGHEEESERPFDFSWEPSPLSIS